MSRFKNSQNDQLAQLYRLYSGWLKRVVRHRFGGDDAEEIVQETYLRISKIARDNVVVYPRALLLKVASNTAVDRARRAGIGALALRLQSDDERELFVRSHQAEDLLLKQIVLTMPLAYRDVFVLNRFAGLTYDEIALRLSLSVKTVEWRMNKALKHCRSKLQAEED